jgi:hypothetical protein
MELGHLSFLLLLGFRRMAYPIHAPRTLTALPSSRRLTSTVKDLVAGSGIAFDDRGTHTLKGVRDERRLYAVTSI